MGGVRGGIVPLCQASLQNLLEVEEGNEVGLKGNNSLVFGASELNPAANETS